MMETNCKIIRNTFDRTEHKDILDAKLGLREMSVKNNWRPFKWQIDRE